MKKLLLIALCVLSIAACQEQRYFTSSPEIDTAKKSIEFYLNGDWENWVSKFSDDAKIYHNNWDKSKTIADAVAGHKSMLANFSSYRYLDDPIFFEMIVKDNGEKWVYYWATWVGISVDGNELKIPLHMASNYKDGKVVTEYGFWDTHNLIITMDEINESLHENELETLNE